MVLTGNSATARIPTATRNRVLSIISQTGYIADPVAQRMVRGRNRILGVFTYEPAFPVDQSDFFTPFLQGIEEAAAKAGYDLLLMTGRSPDAAGAKKIFDGGSRLRLADGCLVLGRSFDRGELTRLVAEDIAFVAIGRRDDAGGPVPYVGADYTTSTRSLVEAAMTRGHRRFAYIGPSDDVEASRDRWHGFMAGLTRPAHMVLHEAETGLAGSDLLKRVRSSGATTVFLTERADAVALHLAAGDAGLRLPRDLSMVVLGSHVRSPNSGVAFTTYHIPREEMGRRATAALVARLDGGGITQDLLTCSIEMGETLADLTREEDVS
jgi:DNA-binding LacI/PurR family transcriptional regulator